MIFYDTSSLLLEAEHLNELEFFAISSITIEELEEIKTSATKDEQIKYQARKVVRFLTENKTSYGIRVFTPEMMSLCHIKDVMVNNDLRILMTAVSLDKEMPSEEELLFCTNDLVLSLLAQCYFSKEKIISVQLEERKIDDYSGYKEIYPTEEELAEFYESLYPDKQKNIYDLYTNEYLIIRDENHYIDVYRWDGYKHIKVPSYSFNSTQFGNIKPMKNDVYQMCAADSLKHNQITMIKGPAGTGKTYLSLAYLFNQFEEGKIDKILIFCNTVATKNSARLGFYPGTRDEKLLDSQIGNLLTSKIGDKLQVERLISEGKIVLLPLSDIRGYDTTGMKAGVYISEAQNLDVSLMKLALQRIGNDSICIIDGDDKTQVDDVSYEGFNNGMKRASQVFRGTDVYGEIELKTIHRSKIAEIAEKM